MFKKALLLISILIATVFLTSAAYQATQQAEINYHAGLSLFEKGKYNDALPFFQRSLSFDPKDREVLRKTAYSYLWTGRPAVASDYFLKALELEPGDMKDRASLADAYAWSGSYGKAMPLYRELFLETGDIRYEKHISELYLWQGNNLKAKVLLDNIIAKDPLDFKTRLLWGKALLYAGDGKKAAAVFEELLKEIKDHKMAEGGR